MSIKFIGIIFSISLRIFVFAEEVKILLPQVKTQHFFEADLVIVGIVDSIEQHQSQDIKVKENSGWIIHYTEYFDRCAIRINSVLKGSISEDTLVFESRTYSGIPTKYKFSQINNAGDSVFTGISEINCDSHSNGLKKNGNYLILFKVIENKYSPIFIEEYYPNQGFNKLKEIK